WVILAERAPRELDNFELFRARQKLAFARVAVAHHAGDPVLLEVDIQPLELVKADRLPVGRERHDVGAVDAGEFHGWLLWLRVGLILRRGFDEGRDFNTRGFDAEEITIAGEIRAEAPRINELRHKTNIGERRRVAKAKLAAPRPGGDHLLQRRKAERDPVARPGDRC